MVNDGEPVKIEDKHLLAYLDGEADAQMIALIETSEEHLERVEVLRRMQNRLKAQLFRVDCPETIDLGEYQLGLLDRKQAKVIERHLAKCPHCQRELNQLRAFMQQETRQEKPDRLEGVKVLIARLLGGGGVGNAPGELTLSPAYVTLRGSDQGPLTLEADGVVIILDIQPTVEKQVKILGQVAADDQEDWTGATVELRRDSTVLMTTNLDDLGAFYSEGLEAGLIELTITTRMGLVVLANFEIRDE